MTYDLSVLIPFLNEEENIPLLTSSLSTFFSAHPGLKTEVLFIDDGSTDGSVEVLKRTKHNGYTARIARLSRNFGSHAALRAGIRNARGNMITFMYADLQDPLSLINRMMESSREGNEIVWAVRSNAPAGTLERVFSGMYARMMQRFAIRNFPSTGFDIVLFGKKTQEVLNAHVESNSSIFLQILTLGFRQKSISYEKEKRKAGKSKWTLGRKIKLLVDSFVAFSFAPIRFVTLMGILFFIFGMGWTIYIILRHFISHDLAQGWPALVSILMIGFVLTNFSLGIVAEYLWRTLDASRKRPVYILDEVIELNN